MSMGERRESGGRAAGRALAPLNLLAVGFYPPRDRMGAERSGWNAARQLARDGHRIRIITEAFGDRRTPRIRNIESVHVETESPLDVRAEDYALAGQTGTGQVAARRGAVRDSFVSAIHRELQGQRPDAILVNWGVPFTSFALEAARDAGIPVITVLHGSDVHTLDQTEFEPVREAVLESYRRADAVIAVADFLRTMLRGMGILRVTTIRNAVDPRQFWRASRSDVARARERLGIPERATVFVHVSNLRPVKQPVTIVDAAEIALRRRRELHFLVVGDGPLGSELRRVVRERRLGRKFTFAGRVAPTAVRGFLVASDVHVMSSRREGTPLAILEALATGRPTIASRVGGIPEIVRHGVNGLLYEPGDIDAFAAHMIRLVDPRVRRRLSEGAIRSSRRHSMEELGRSYESVIRGAIAARKAT
jgi:glycosyltransferase involved in cell wall biosynthesis